VSVCIPPIVARQQLGKHVPEETNTHNNIRITGRVVFYAAHIISSKSRHWFFPEFIVILRNMPHLLDVPTSPLIFKIWGF
jgi:hypothetical protein